VGWKALAYRNSTEEVALMSIDRAVIAVAGAMILASLLLSQLHHPYWLWLTAFVGANLLQSAFTGFCPLAIILKRAGVRPGEAFQ
jgi:hypothetical protein